MIVKRLSEHGNAFEYLRYKFPQMADQLADLPIVEPNKEEWEENHLSGTGYYITPENIQNIKDNLSRISPERAESMRQMDPLVARDIFIYDIYQKINVVPFMMAEEGNEGAIVHELAHDVWENLGEDERSGIKLPEVNPADGDEYLTRDSERFTHMHEMEYFKSQGVSYDEYFRKTNSQEYGILTDPGADPKMKELALMDYQDYKSMWNQVTASKENWLQKSAALALQKGTHTSTGAPIYYLSGNGTYPIRKELGRSGLGFAWYKARQMWWMTASRMTPRVLQGLQSLGVDASVASEGQQVAPVAPTAQDPVQTPQMSFQEPQQVPSAPSMTIDQSWEGAGEKSNWYGFPIKEKIYQGDFEVQVDGQPRQMQMEVSRSVVKGRRKIPSYIVRTIADGDPILVFKVPSPDKQFWGRYDEGDLISKIPENIQKRLDQKGKTYKQLIYNDQLRLREPELEQFLQSHSKYDNTGSLNASDPIIKMLQINEPGLEGEYPVKFAPLGKSWYGDTALEHSQAPRPTAVYYLGGLPAEVHSIDEFSVWLDQQIADPENLQRAQENYIKYLKSFAFTEEAQAEATAQFDEVLPLVENQTMDVPFFRQKLMERGYVRPRKRQKKQGPGMVPQGGIKVIIDSNKIKDDLYSFGSKLSNSPDYFYTVIAYMMHRQKAGNIGFMPIMIIDGVRKFTDVLKMHGATVDSSKVYDYIESLSKLLLRDILEIEAGRPAADAWSDFYSGGVGGGNIPAQGALEQFTSFVVSNSDMTPEQVQTDPKSAYRRLAMMYHPDRNPNNPEAEQRFIELGNHYEAWQRTASNWFGRLVCG